MWQFAWLKALFTQLPSHRAGQAFAQAAAGEAAATKLDDMLPDRRLQSHPAHAWTIDDLRRAERNRHSSIMRSDPFLAPVFSSRF